MRAAHLLSIACCEPPCLHTCRTTNVQHTHGHGAALRRPTVSVTVSQEGCGGGTSTAASVRCSCQHRLCVGALVRLCISSEQCTCSAATTPVTHTHACCRAQRPLCPHDTSPHNSHEIACPTMHYMYHTYTQHQSGQRALALTAPCAPATRSQSRLLSAPPRAAWRPLSAPAPLPPRPTPPWPQPCPCRALPRPQPQSRLPPPRASACSCRPPPHPFFPQCSLGRGGGRRGAGVGGRPRTTSSAQPSTGRASKGRGKQRTWAEAQHLGPRPDTDGPTPGAIQPCPPPAGPHLPASCSSSRRSVQCNGSRKHQEGLLHALRCRGLVSHEP